MAFFTRASSVSYAVKVPSFEIPLVPMNATKAFRSCKSSTVLAPTELSDVDRTRPASM